MQIYINKNGQNLGPFDEAKVAEMLQNGQLLPNDLGIKKGQQQWQKLSELFPPVQSSVKFEPPSIQPPAKSGGSKGLIFGLIGCGGLILLGIIGTVAFFALSGGKKSADSASGNKTDSSKPNQVKAPAESKNAKPLLDKAEELMKMNPPLKIEANPIIKGKLAIVKKDKDSYEADIIGFEHQGKFFPPEYTGGIDFSQNRLATTPEEIDTLMLISCQKGGALGRYEGGTTAYANTCKITLIDYKAPAIIAQQSFTNKTPPLHIRSQNGGEYVLLPPPDYDEFIAYLPAEKLSEPLAQFSVDSDGGRYGEYSGLQNLASELVRVAAPENLNPSAAIKGKVAVVHRSDSRTTMKGIDVYGKELSGFESWGISKNQQATKIDELETLIKIDCRKGSKLGNVGRITVFSDKCEVSIIDYKNWQTIAKNTFENKEMRKDMDKDVYDSRYIVTEPTTEIDNYLKSFPKN